MTSSLSIVFIIILCWHYLQRPLQNILQTRENKLGLSKNNIYKKKFSSNIDTGLNKLTEGERYVCNWTNTFS